METDPPAALLDDVCVATLGLCGRHPVIRKVGTNIRFVIGTALVSSDALKTPELTFRAKKSCNVNRAGIYYDVRDPGYKHRTCLRSVVQIL
jgi:hypothetical protein